MLEFLPLLRYNTDELIVKGEHYEQNYHHSKALLK